MNSKVLDNVDWELLKKQAPNRGLLLKYIVNGTDG